MERGKQKMVRIDLLPELRTSGGEAVSIYRDGDWIGDMYLIYRENDLLTGSIHLDEMFVTEDDVREISSELRGYLVNLASALNVADSNINVIHGQYALLEDYESPIEAENYAVDEEVINYERWIVGQGEQGIEYQIYDENKELVAEAIVDIKGTKIIGEINFTFDPTEKEMEDVEAILLKDYDHDLIDQYSFTYCVNNDEIEQVEIEAIDDDEEDDNELAGEFRLVEQEEWEDDDELGEAKVVYDLFDVENRDFGAATFHYSEDGVEVTVDLDMQPNEEVSHHLMKTVFQEALTDPMEWVKIRMYHNGELFDGFQFERGQ
jgi:hypothetical protein